MRLKKGSLVLVEHGASKRGQVAVVVKPGKDLVELRKFKDSTKTFGANTVTLPIRSIMGSPERSDERAKAARAALKAEPKLGSESNG